jgi:hypothetical protein
VPRSFRPAALVAALALGALLPAVPAQAETITVDGRAGISTFRGGAKAAASRTRARVWHFSVRGLRPSQVRGAAIVAGKRRRPVAVRTVRTALRRQRDVRVRTKLRGRPVRLKLKVDRRAPDTKVKRTRKGRSIQLAADERRARFACRVDGGRWKACPARTQVPALPAGDHDLDVRASDRAGNVDPTPATVTWTVEPAPAPKPTAPAAPPVTTTPQPPAGTLLFDGFDGPDSVITNGYAYFSRDTRAFRSDIWEVEVGTLLRRGGTGWSGVPDGNDTNRDSSAGTGSQMFRMWTKRDDFGNVRVTTKLRHEGWTEGSPDWPVKSWDGLKLWLRRGGRTGSFNLYTAEVSRRQGNIMIQKKCQDSDEYTILEQSRSGGEYAPRIGEWDEVGGSVRTNSDGSVTIEVIRGGRVVLTATDTGEGGCPPITAPGRVGIRSENMQFSIDDFAVRPA